MHQNTPHLEERGSVVSLGLGFPKYFRAVFPQIVPNLRDSMSFRYVPIWLRVENSKVTEQQSFLPKSALKRNVWWIQVHQCKALGPCILCIEDTEDIAPGTFGATILIVLHVRSLEREVQEEASHLSAVCESLSISICPGERTENTTNPVKSMQRGFSHSACADLCRIDDSSCAPRKCLKAWWPSDCSRPRIGSTWAACVAVLQRWSCISAAVARDCLQLGHDLFSKCYEARNSNPLLQWFFPKR